MDDVPVVFCKVVDDDEMQEVHERELLRLQVADARAVFRAQFWQSPFSGSCSHSKIAIRSNGNMMVSLRFLNLDRRCERRHTFLNQLQRFPSLLALAERVPAQDGQLLSCPADVDSDAVSQVGACRAFDPRREVNGRRLTRGACAQLSTVRSVLAAIAEAPCERSVHIVCEDDAVLCDEFPERFSELLHAADVHEPSWHLLHLGFVEPPLAGSPVDPCTLDSRCSACSLDESLGECPFVGRPRRLFGCYGLALRPAGARSLLRHLFPASFQLDSALNALYGEAAHSVPRIYVLAPTRPLISAPPSSDGNTDIQVLGEAGHAAQYGLSARRQVNSREQRLREKFEAHGGNALIGLCEANGLFTGFDRSLRKNNAAVSFPDVEFPFVD